MWDTIAKIGGKVLDKVGIGNVLQFGGNLLSGMQQSENAEDARHAAEMQQARNIAMQKEFAQMGLRWKVEDARAAGLHPLSAIGAAGAAFAPNPVVVADGAESGVGKAFGEMGQNLSRAALAQETEDQRSLRQAQIAAAWAQVAESDARAWLANSEAALNQQRMLQSAPMPPEAGNAGTVTHRSSMPAALFDNVNVKPEDVVSTRFEDMSTTSGVHGYWKEHVYQDGKPGRRPVPMVLPYSESGPGEMEIPWWRWFTEVIPENIRRYGWSWPRQYLMGGDAVGPTVSGRIRR